MYLKLHTQFLTAAFASLFCLAAGAQEAQWTNGSETLTGTLSQALSGCSTGSTIQLLSNVTATTALTLTDKTATLDGGGFTITRASSLTQDNLLTVSGSTAILTLAHVTLDGGAVWNSPDSLSQVLVNSGISATGATIKVTGGAGLVINEGTLICNTSNMATTYNAGAINVNAGTVVMNSGLVRMNESGMNGGALFLNGSSSFIMNGGQITWNTARNGGAIVLNSSAATFTMNGGTIDHNRATYLSGSGGAIWAKGTVSLTGGSITGNYATKLGGGLYLLNGGTLTGGTIEGNVAGSNGKGIYYYSGDNVTLGDSIYVDADNEIYLITGKGLTIASTLSRHSAQKKLMVNTTSTADNTLVATFTDSTLTATQQASMAKAGLKYIEHMQDCDLNASGNTIIIGTVETTYFMADESKSYAINRNGNTTTGYIIESGSNLATGAFDTTSKCYWSFVSTGKDGCYYIKNSTTGDYIQSSHISLSGQVSTGSNPVEFYVAKDMTAGATTYGYYYLCSTDQTISNATDGTLGLNFGSTGVVAFYIKTGRANSYWQITEKDYAYEQLSFKVAESIDDRTTASKYYLATATGKYFTTTGGNFALGTTAGESDAWYFVGSSNTREGLILANYGLEGYTLNYNDGVVTLSQQTTPSRWYVKEIQKEGKRYYSLIPFAYKDSTGYVLSIEGETEFLLNEFRTNYAKSLQFYYYPCGGLIGGGTNQYLTKVSITGENVSKELLYESTSRPTDYYVLYLASKATVSRGTAFTLQMDGSTAGTSTNNILGMTLYPYFDWDGDAVFETALGAIKGAATTTLSVNVPESATEGLHRLRIRVTANGLDGAEDEVEGTTYDFIVNVTAPVEGRTVTVKPNNSTRGSVTISQQAATYPYGTSLTVTATPAGTSTFLYWKDGKQQLSTDAVYTFMVTQDMELTAYFSPNTNPDAVIPITQDSTHKGATGIYDLKGNRVVIPAKGIYIINGTKKLIK